MLLEVFPACSARMRRDIHSHIQTHMHNTNTQTYAPRHVYSFPIDVSNICESSSNQISSSTATFPCSLLLFCGILPYLLFLILLLTMNFPFGFIFRTFYRIVFSQICFYKSVGSFHAIYIHYISHTHTHEYVHNLHTHAPAQTNKLNKREILQSTLRAAHQITHQNIGGVRSCRR